MLRFGKFSLVSRLAALACSRDLAACLVLLAVGFFGAINCYTRGTLPSADGDKYDKIIRQYIDGGYSFGAIDTRAFIASDQTRSSYQGRVVYFWVIARIHRITGAELQTIYPWFNGVFFVLAAIAVYFICRGPGRLPVVPSVFAGALLLLLPGTTLIYKIVAHPDPMALFFTAVTFLAYERGRHRVGAVCLLLALLSKQSAIFLLIFMVLEQFFKTGALAHARATALDEARRFPWFLAGYAAAAVAAWAIPHWLIPATPTRFSISMVWRILDLNRFRVFDHLLNNFSILWIPFAGQLLRESRPRQMAIVYTLLLSIPVACYVVTDWFRAWYCFMFVFVLPFAARYVWTDFSRTLGARNVFLVFTGLLMILAKESSREANQWLYLAVIGVFAVNLALSRHFFAAIPTEKD